MLSILTTTCLPILAPIISTNLHMPRKVCITPVLPDEQHPEHALRLNIQVRGLPVTRACYERGVACAAPVTGTCYERGVACTAPITGGGAWLALHP